MIEAFVMLGAILDLLLTYKFLALYKKRFPKKDYTIVETNPLIRIMIRSLGLHEGMIISGTAIILILMLLLSIIPYQWKYFLAGVYYMMICFHLVNFLSLRKMEVRNNGRTNRTK